MNDTRRVITVLVALFLLCSCKKSVELAVIPAPVRVEASSCRPFVFENGTAIVGTDDEADAIASFYREKFLSVNGIVLSSEDCGKGVVELLRSEDVDLPAEGYRLEVSDGKITITAADKAGLFYGMATLVQLVPCDAVSAEIPAVKITDYPRFKYRGLHLDPCRHFLSVEDVKKHLDIMSELKFNVMHFHLTDDQGWRFEVKKYPLLTEIGSERVEGEGFVHSGFYTQDELRELVRYAQERQITIIPEIEVPGHALSAISAYPWISCRSVKTPSRIIWGVEDVVMCAGKESTFKFIEDVIAELVEIFPSEYIHIGGDECPKGEWEKCPLCQKVIKEQGLSDSINGVSPEMRLQGYFVSRVEKIVEKYGRRIIGWDEILEGGLPESATVMSWRGVEGGIEAALGGHDAIMTPVSGGMYLDFFQGDKKCEPVTIGGYVPLEKVYSYNPVPDTLKTLGLEEHIIGVQGNTWSEYMYDESIREYRIYPRAIALAEIAWTPLENKDFKSFCNRLERSYLRRLDRRGINYHIPLPEQPYGSCSRVAFTDKAVLEFTTSRPVEMVYTLDGSEPDAGSARYSEPIVIDKSSVLKIRSLLPTGRLSSVRTIEVVKENFREALEPVDVEPGLNLKVVYGDFLTRESFLKALESYDRGAKGVRGYEKSISDLKEIRSQEPSNNVMRNFPQYGAVASGYIYIPEDGIYYFSTNNNDLSLDGELIISNDGKVKRFSTMDYSVALKKGYHAISVTFLGHIIGGWPSNWDSGRVLIRESNKEKFEEITSQMLFRKK